MLHKIAQTEGLNHLDAQIEALEESDDDSRESKIKVTDFGKVELGAASKPVSFTELESRSPAFKDLTLKANQLFKDQDEDKLKEEYGIIRQAGETVTWVPSYFSVSIFQSPSF